MHGGQQMLVQGLKTRNAVVFTRNRTCRISTCGCRPDKSILLARLVKEIKVLPGCFRSSFPKAQLLNCTRT
jgi:hypothetical protein